MTLAVLGKGILFCSLKVEMVLILTLIWAIDFQQVAVYVDQDLPPICRLTKSSISDEAILGFNVLLMNMFEGIYSVNHSLPFL